MKKVLILVCFLIVLSGIGIVSAETLTGTLGSDSTDSQISYVLEEAAAPTFGENITFNMKGIETLSGLSVIIHFDQSDKKWTYAAGAPDSVANIPFNIKATVDGAIVGTGTFGYQRAYNGGGTEIGGYQWWLFDTWTASAVYTGDKSVICEMNMTEAYNPTPTTGNPNFGSLSDSERIGVSKKTGNPTYEAFGAIGSYYITTQDSVLNDYTATSPAGIGTTGIVYKSSGGTNYTSRAYVFNASGAILASEAGTSSDNLIFNVPTSSIKIGIQSPNLGTWYNTSVLFGAEVTPTPTVTMTPVPTVAPGYVRSNVWVMDHLGNSVHGVDIAMYDVEGTAWSNSTSDADGQHYIDTLPYHTLNLYADFTAFPGEFLPSSLLGVETGYYGNGYYLVLYPAAAPAGEGNTNLYITVMDEDTGDLIRAASLTVTYGTTTQGGTTGTTGTEIFVVPNQTDIRIAASKFGYTSATQYLNSGEGTVVNTQIELSKLLVTTVPTSTIPPGGVTPAVTADPNDPAITGSTNAKGQEMLNWLAMNGMDLVQLCFLVTMLALLGVKLGK